MFVFTTWQPALINHWKFLLGILQRCFMYGGLHSEKESSAVALMMGEYFWTIRKHKPQTGLLKKLTSLFVMVLSTLNNLNLCMVQIQVLALLLALYCIWAAGSLSKIVTTAVLVQDSKCFPKSSVSAWYYYCKE